MLNVLYRYHSYKFCIINAPKNLLVSSICFRDRRSVSFVIPCQSVLAAGFVFLHTDKTRGHKQELESYFMAY